MPFHPTGQGYRDTVVSVRLRRGRVEWQYLRFCLGRSGQDVETEASGSLPTLLFLPRLGWAAVEATGNTGQAAAARPASVMSS